jgi:Holliday junction resolvase RusA-like endonuclease
MKLEFFMPMQPPTVTKQEQDVTIVKSKKGKLIPHFFDPPELKTARVKLRDHLAGHIPENKYTGPVRLITKWLFPITGKHHDGEYKTTRPDTGNLQKMLCDVMTDLGYWTDDALIVSEITEKFWAENPGIYICIEELK